MSSKDSFGGSDEKKAAQINVTHVAVADKEVDTAAQLAAALDEELSPEEAVRIRKKIDWHILPLMCSRFMLLRFCVMEAHYPSSLLDSIHG